jgi:hypothetical protein
MNTAARSSMMKSAGFAVGLLLALSGFAACNTSLSPVAPTAVVQAASAAQADSAPAPTSQPGPRVGAQIIQGHIDAVGVPEILVVDGQRIRMLPGAAFRSGGTVLTFNDLRVGAEVRVFAEGDGANTLQGSLVELLSS